MMKKNKVLTWIVLLLAIAINAFIIVNACINGEASAAESNAVAHTTADIINTVKPQTITEANFPSFAETFRKAVGHFGLFVVSGIITTWAYVLIANFADEIIQAVCSIFFGLFIALVSEFIQLFTRGRSATFVDVGIDALGYLLGVFILILIVFIVKSIKFHKNK